MGKGPTFTENTHATLKQFLTAGPSGNRWFKVNLHVHAEGNKPPEIVQQARAAEIDLLAITDHQAFTHYEAVVTAASTPGRPLTVLPGMEITSLEGVHVLALFPADFTSTQRTQFIGWLEIPGTGDATIASKRQLSEILKKVNDERGIIVVPHPFAEKSGLLDSSRKISTKVAWLESGHIHLMQLSPETDDKVRHYDRDARGNWINRFVLTSATVQQLEESTYCLAPINRSDAHKPAEIPEGCSWFRMSEPSIAGLQQVACEPGTRIARKLPKKDNADCILGVRIQGGYCDGQLFVFNERLNCIIGPNHAGKSAVLDFVRFALTDEDRLQHDSKLGLLARLNAILGAGGQVEVYVRHRGDMYAIRRTFSTQMNPARPSEITGCSEEPHSYKLDGDELAPVDGFRMPVEVYEQGRISRLRDDVARQLEMLDEFANLRGLTESRSDIVSKLNKSAEKLAPLYEERDDLQSRVDSLPDLKAQLAQMEKLTPGEEEKKWGKANTAVAALVGRIEDLEGISADMPDPGDETESPETDLERVFAQELPDFDPTKGAQPALLAEWRTALKAALDEIAAARANISSAIQALVAKSRVLEKKWTKAHDEYEREISRRLSEVGVESPKEVIERVKKLQVQIDQIEGAKQRRLAQVSKLITQGEGDREALLADLERVGQEIKAKREDKARELTAMLDDQIRITIAPSGDFTGYRQVLEDFCQKGTTPGGRLRNRESQIEAIVSRLSPLALARALKNNGVVIGEGGSQKPVHQVCPGVTESATKALVAASRDIRTLNVLQCTAVPDVPIIMVRRRGETSYGDLGTGLSPGEQSAALLTVALQTRTMPLILDQPEDELGYSYVVHLVVPKILSAKATRQLLVVTHNANIPVLGDADHVTRMENQPGGPRGRTCVIDQAGCFENPKVTAALLDLEGGAQAFQFRNHRYALRK